MIFMYKVENIILVKKQKFIIEDLQNNIFIMYACYRKNIVSIYQNNIMFDINKLAFRTFFLNIKKCHLSVFQKVSFLFIKI